ncbi:MAG: hypothetical protein Q9226_005296 [Calogaya cf. arnoldii]
MCLPSTLRKSRRKWQEPPVRNQGVAHGGGYDLNDYKEPVQASTSSHSGHYDPNRQVNAATSGRANHGGSWKPSQYKTASSDNRVDHGGGYRPDPTSHIISTSQDQRPNPSHGGKRPPKPRGANRTQRKAQQDAISPKVEPWDVHDVAKTDEEAGLVPRKGNQLYHHRDVLKRPYSGQRDTRFLSPKDGRPTKLIVQSSEDVLANTSGVDWTRKPIDNAGPWMFRLTHWATADGHSSVFLWLPACAVLTVVLLNPFPVTTETLNNGFYEPVPYKDWQYPYDARNRYENPPYKGAPSRPLKGQIERVSEPAYLCLVEGTEIINVQQWRKLNGTDVALEYVMVSYTSGQFVTDDDKRSLEAIGKHAAIAAKVKAYWLGCSCLGSVTEEEGNVYRISDVIRGALQVVIAVAGPVGVKEEGQLPVKLLHEWGNRVWTLPELLLSPERDIQIYTLNRSLDPAQQLKQCLNMSPDMRDRRNFSRVWEDDNIVGQLMDHYEGSVILSPLELMATALRCLERRHTTQYLPGDLSYSLMGLLRQRPNARKDDSAFQAFARLSLANDSNMLLERLICLLPPSPYEPWHCFQDHWDAALWDVYPCTQVCGIGENDTIILNGARAATIRWKSFKKVILRGNRTIVRRIAVIALTIVSPLFVGAIAMLAASNPIRFPDRSAALKDMGVADPSALLKAIGGLPDPGPTLKGIGGTFLALCLLVLLLSPWLIKILYLGKVWSAQPWFFGLEGYMPLHEIEKNLFGVDLGRLSWSTTSSSLSRHDVLNHKDFANYCEGQDPKSDPEINARIQKALRSTDTQEKIFTLVDTYTMTVTLFAAVKPPVAILACGEEGGMQRALLCSYDWTDNTMYRETVVRVETPVYWRMSPIRRVRLGLQTRAKMG